MKKYHIELNITSDEIDQLRDTLNLRLNVIDGIIRNNTDPVVEARLDKVVELLNYVDQSLAMQRFLQTEHEAPSVSELRG